MPRHSAAELRAISAAATREVIRWDLSAQAQRRAALSARRPGAATECRPFIAISRETGVGGADLARSVADRLGFDCLDSELLTYIAAESKLPKSLLERVDEKRSDWVREAFGYRVLQHTLSPSSFASRIGKVVMLAASSGSAVFVGRGAQFFLPREAGLALRIIAPLELRIESMMQRLGIDRAAAELHIEEIDAGRADFIRRRFRRDVTDPSLYDMILNTEQLDPDQAVDLIVYCFRMRFP